MLTSDLLRVTLRKGVLKPTYLKPKNERAAALAEALLAMYRDAAGSSREELDEWLQELIGDAPDFLLTRGLAKLLDDRCTWTSEALVAPDALRRALYDAASRRPKPARAAIIEEVGAAFSLTPAQVEASMFADLKGAELLESFDDLSGEELLARYNVGLAQAVLLRATQVVIQISGATAAELRSFLQVVKFHQLMCVVQPNGGNGCTITLDGPLSILQRSSRYGVKLAMLLPSLLHLTQWRLDSTIRWGNRDAMVEFSVASTDKLQPFGKLRGAWISEEQRLVEARLAEHKSGWRVEASTQVLPLGDRDMLVPDMTLVHPDGRFAYVDVVGTWRRSWLERRLALLAEKGPANLVLCVSKSLAAEKEELDGLPGELVVFSSVISLPKLLAAVEKVAFHGHP